MSKAAVANAVMQHTSIAREQAITTYNDLRAPMRKWHVYAAYLIRIAYLLQIGHMLVKGIRFPKPLSCDATPKEQFEGILYILFYLLLTVNVITGAYIKWIDGDLKKTFETAHKLAIYRVPAFVLLHIGGIWIGELRNKKGVVSKMIGGD